MLEKIVLLILTFAVVISFANAQEPNSREFELTYSFTINEIPGDSKEVKFWVPVPQDTENQTITDISVDTKAEFSINTEDIYKNKILSGKIAANGSTEIPVTVSFKVKRIELLGNELKADGSDVGNMSIFLKANRLVTLSDRVMQISAEVTNDKSTTTEKARAIYDYVIDKMAYDKSGKGWGRGDTEYACDISKGNCTDFHSLFISLARAAGIPARFKIGFPIPADKDAGKIGGYHCWAEYYDSSRGWIPVDASEAKKNPEKKEYFFGNICENRVELSAGRDITLNPPQAGEKLNFFIYPYIEVDGLAHSMYEKSFSFKNI